MVVGQAVDQTAQDEILNHGAVPVKKDHARRSGIAPFDIVKAHSVAIGKDTDRRILSLRCHLKRDVAEDQNDKSRQNDQQTGFSCGHRVNLHS
ncbi:hypothetical protein BwSH20_17210 [Bradyrhizobium ottawaense]|nr:hypothetical protein SG09_04370 [Bradyrhizobium ottawaense]GMO14287.1 hypothetical protein BwSF21_02340 [Bradyrhizobium ottawaense]GMO19365.1 hypothetical protein BwSF12_08380 [Bradyrhizobium ottawaense]GMO32539.1 hypothetical protein BwSH14_35860 [Bradyrhizobium ottawaense]GMO57705.1 hypothetical protein BwSG20_09130 [Bradyrhizobium ottawaense]